MTAISEDLDYVEKCIKDLEDSLKNIKDEMTKTDFAAEIFIVKLKHEKIRAMSAVAKSQAILANMDQMLANTEFGVAVSNLGSIISRQSSTNKKKADAHSDESSHKKVKLTSEREPEKHRSKSRSSRSDKENRKKHTSTKKNTSKSKEKVLEPQVSLNTNVPPTPKTLPCSEPLRNLTNSIWPVFDKKTIFLSNPPVRDTKVNKNIGYYSTAHANEILGYDPDTLPQVQSNRFNYNSLPANPLSSSRNRLQLNRAYNLSVTPGYNLSVSPGYVVQHQAQVHRTEDSVSETKEVVSKARDWVKPKINSSSNQTDTLKVTGEENNCNDDITNKLFRDLMCNKTNEAKYEDIQSLASAETLVITTKFKIDSDFDTFQEF